MVRDSMAMVKHRVAGMWEVERTDGQKHDCGRRMRAWSQAGAEATGEDRTGPVPSPTADLTHTHLGQTCGHCPVSAQLGIEARLFGSSPAAQDPSTGPGLCLLVGHSEAQDQWSRVTAG